MEDQCQSGTISDGSCSVGRSDSRLTGEKRGSVESVESAEIACKRAKMRDLESLSRPDGFATDGPTSLKIEKGSDVDQFSKESVPQIAPDSVTLNVSGSKEGTEKKCDGSLDLNTEEQLSLRNPDRVGLDLNVEDVSSSINLHPSKNHSHIRSKDVSESGSTSGPSEDNESLRRWKEMKENGFVSASYGGKPLPKQRVRRSKAQTLKKKIEIAKREQVDRFTKIAAPSGLLNELNPGIINHVRNRRQVHSIIESLVRSEKLENDFCGSKQPDHLKSSTEIIIRKESDDEFNDSGTNQIGFSCENSYLHTLSESKEVMVYPTPVDEKSGDDDSSMLEGVYGKSCAVDSTLLNENDALVLKLASTANVSENTDSFSNEESGNLISVSSLSVKAATVASQWLELLHQDVKGRLAALRRSKKRVRAVINTELPFLISKEFSSNQENDPHLMKSCTEGLSVNATAEMHRARWTALFNQMDHSLSEEEEQLESWLNQVKEMQLHCDQGLQHLHWNPTFGLQQLGTSENDFRPGKAESPEKELAVHAAAASIYSTCNYLMSKENVPCF